VRYATPVGPLRVDYGFKLNKERGESDGELHFSIGQAF
jgi:outer membrane protein insertion porin family